MERGLCMCNAGFVHLQCDFGLLKEIKVAFDMCPLLFKIPILI